MSDMWSYAQQAEDEIWDGVMARTNYYGQPIVPPEYYDGAHVASPGPAGMPPVCSCGWTRWEHAPGEWYELADHLREVEA